MQRRGKKWGKFFCDLFQRVLGSSFSWRWKHTSPRVRSSDSAFCRNTQSTKWKIKLKLTRTLNGYLHSWTCSFAPLDLSLRWDDHFKVLCSQGFFKDRWPDPFIPFTGEHTVNTQTQTHHVQQYKGFHPTPRWGLATFANKQIKMMPAPFLLSYLFSDQCHNIIIEPTLWMP